MWPNPHETADLVTLTGEILNRKRHFLYCEVSSVFSIKSEAYPGPWETPKMESFATMVNG